VYDQRKVAEMRALADIAEQLGVVYLLQGCTPAVGADYKDEHDCWAVDFLGRRPLELLACAILVWTTVIRLRLQQ